MTALAPSLAAFLREHLPRERRASPHTCEAYAYSFQLLPHLVAGTDRVATMHRRFAEQQLAGLPVRCVRPLFEVPKFDQVLHWHKYRDLDPGSQWLRDRILEAAKALPPLTEYGD